MYYGVEALLDVNEDAAIEAKIRAVYDNPSNGYMFNWTHNEPTINGQIASVTLKPGMTMGTSPSLWSGQTFYLNEAKYMTTHTYKFDNGCEGVSAMTAAADPS